MSEWMSECGIHRPIALHSLVFVCHWDVWTNWSLMDTFLLHSDKCVVQFDVYESIDMASWFISFTGWLCWVGASNWLVLIAGVFLLGLSYNELVAYGEWRTPASHFRLLYEHTFCTYCFLIRRDIRASQQITITLTSCVFYHFFVMLSVIDCDCGYSWTQN